MVNIDALKAAAVIIRDETGASENTALRVGRLLLNMIEVIEGCVGQLETLQTSVVVLPESELEAMAEAGVLQDGILYLGTEEDEL